MDVTRDAELEALEAALVAQRPGVEDPGAFETWLRHEGASPGRSPSVPTVEAFALYRRWAESVGAVPVAPFVFARRMLGVFDKRPASMRRPEGGYRWTPCYLMGERAARRLRAQAADHPPSAEDRALFTFRALREARHPSRKES